MEFHCCSARFFAGLRSPSPQNSLCLADLLTNYFRHSSDDSSLISESSGFLHSPLVYRKLGCHGCINLCTGFVFLASCLLFIIIIDIVRAITTTAIFIVHLSTYLITIEYPFLELTQNFHLYFEDQT